MSIDSYRITLICSIDGSGVLSIRQIGFSWAQMCCTHDSQKFFSNFHVMNLLNTWAVPLGILPSCLTSIWSLRWTSWLPDGAVDSEELNRTSLLCPCEITTYLSTQKLWTGNEKMFGKTKSSKSGHKNVWYDTVCKTYRQRKLIVIQPASISDAICGLCKFKKSAKFEF